MRGLSVLIGITCCFTSYAETVQRTTVSVVSDRVYHGLTESTENPGVAVHGEIHGKRGFAGLLAEYSRADRRPERHRALGAYAGLDQVLDESGWRLSGEVRYRKFIESNKEWDYWEFSSQLQSSSGFGLAIDYAPDYYSHDTRALVYQISQFHEFDDRWYAFGSGAYASFSRAEDYVFASVGGGIRMDRNTVELSYDWHDLEGNHRFRDPIDRSRVRLTWSHRIR